MLLMTSQLEKLPGRKSQETPDGGHEHLGKKIRNCGK